MKYLPLLITLAVTSCSPIPYWSWRQDPSSIVGGNAPSDIKGCIIYLLNDEGVTIRKFPFSLGATQKSYYPKMDWDHGFLGVFSGYQSCRYYKKTSHQTAQIVSTIERDWPFVKVADGCGTEGYTLHFDNAMGGSYTQTINANWVAKDAAHSSNQQYGSGRFKIERL